MAMWILVGDEASARLFEADDEANNWTPIEVFSHPQSRMKADEINEDRPDGSDQLLAREFEGGRFAKQVARYFDSRQNSFDRLIIVGPPRFLGLLRKELSNPVAKKLTDSLAKELTNMNERELQEKLTIDLML